MIFSKKKCVICEFLDENGQGVLKVWMDEHAQDRDLVARVDQKLDLLEDYRNDLPRGLLDGTKQKHVDKLRIFGKKTTWRFMISRERTDGDFAFTVLYIAQEKDRKLIPKDAYDRAEASRQKFISDPKRRRIYERNNGKTINEIPK